MLLDPTRLLTFKINDYGSIVVWLFLCQRYLFMIIVSSDLISQNMKVLVLFSLLVDATLNIIYHYQRVNGSLFKILISMKFELQA